MTPDDLDVDSYEEQAHACIASVHADLTRIHDAAEALDDPTKLAQILWALRNVKALAAEAYAATEKALLDCMPDRRLEVDGLGVFEAKPRTRRTEWRNEELVAALRPHLTHDRSTGEELTGSQTFDLLAKAFALNGYSVRYDTMRALLGLGRWEPLDEWCHEERTREVKLPPLDVERPL